MEANTSELQDQVRQDIDVFVGRYKDPRKALNMLSSRSNIHTKTLKRLLDKTHRPGYQTLYKLYSSLLETTDLSSLVRNAPPAIRDKLQKSDPQLKTSPLHKYNLDIEKEILKDSCFAELYVLAETQPFDLRFVKHRFGVYGEEILHKMLQMNVLRQLGNGQYGLGENRAPFSAKSIKSVGIRLTERYSKPSRTDENYANYMGLFFESVNELTYRKWIEIEERAFRERIELLQDPSSRGTLPVFMFSVIDTLREPSS
ncbi:hypothetical protein [Bdellovibrio svalbardensis]|uniref:DUF4423 domain-containing protein n=1 Tax=Bdellovibrio svalbardensis TaxID=2972972 RepID=A0ABT6DG49_9BACT|nr:hypothetical protein [Bdellovibrio svalbardensis]MDG0815796.1 hypothetical protein [Bdellovibrio svalbardensis]